MDPDTLASLCHYLQREGVSSARVVEILPWSYAARCCAGDGSEWYIATDRYANRFGWADTVEGAMAQAGTLAVPA